MKQVVDGYWDDGLLGRCRMVFRGPSLEAIVLRIEDWMRIGWRLGILPGKSAEAVDAFGVDVPFLAPALVLVLVLVPFLQALRCP